MAFDWNTFNQGLDGALDRAEERTNDKLASRISSLTRMTDKEVKELFPKSADVNKLARLMDIVKSSEERNKKIVRLKDNLEDLGDVAITLLDKFV